MKEHKNLTINDYIDLLHSSSIIYSVGFSNDKYPNHVTAYPFDDARLKPLDYWGDEQEVLEELEYYYKTTRRKERKMNLDAAVNRLASIFSFSVSVFSFVLYLALASGIIFFLWRLGLLSVVFK